MKRRPNRQKPKTSPSPDFFCSTELETGISYIESEEEVKTLYHYQPQLANQRKKLPRPQNPNLKKPQENQRKNPMRTVSFPQQKHLFFRINKRAKDILDLWPWLVVNFTLNPSGIVFELLGDNYNDPLHTEQAKELDRAIENLELVGCYVDLPKVQEKSDKNKKPMPEFQQIKLLQEFSKSLQKPDIPVWLYLERGMVSISMLKQHSDQLYKNQQLCQEFVEEAFDTTIKEQNILTEKCDPGRFHYFVQFLAEEWKDKVIIINDKDDQRVAIRQTRKIIKQWTKEIEAELEGIVAYPVQLMHRLKISKTQILIRAQALFPAKLGVKVPVDSYESQLSGYKIPQQQMFTFYGKLADCEAAKNEFIKQFELLLKQEVKVSVADGNSSEVTDCISNLNAKFKDLLSVVFQKQNVSLYSFNQKALEEAEEMLKAHAASGGTVNLPRVTISNAEIQKKEIQKDLNIRDTRSITRVLRVRSAVRAVSQQPNARRRQPPPANPVQRPNKHQPIKPQPQPIESYPQPQPIESQPQPEPIQPAPEKKKRCYSTSIRCASQSRNPSAAINFKEIVAKFSVGTILSHDVSYINDANNEVTILRMFEERECTIQMLEDSIKFIFEFDQTEQLKFAKQFERIKEILTELDHRPDEKVALPTRFEFSAPIDTIQAVFCTNRSDLLLQLSTPAEFFIYTNIFQRKVTVKDNRMQSLSPLNIGDDHPLLNYWNLNQLFQLHLSTANKNKLVSHLQLTNESLKIEENLKIITIKYLSDTGLVQLEEQLLTEIRKLPEHLQLAVFSYISTHTVSLLVETQAIRFTRLVQHIASKNPADLKGGQLAYSYVMDLLAEQIVVEELQHADRSDEEQSEQSEKQEKEKEEETKTGNEKNHKFRDENNYVHVFEQLCQNNQILLNFELLSKKGLLYTRKLKVTPTLRRISHGFFEEQCHFYRSYEDLKHLILHVQFTEEDENSPAWFSTVQNGKIWYIYEHFVSGISLLPVGADDPPQFRYLGRSNSSFREVQFQFIAKIQEPEQLFVHLGEFDGIQKRLLKDNRKGQMFSTSQKVVDVPVEQIDQIDDIKKYDEQKKMDVLYTDGCGCISKSLAEKVAKVFNQEYVSACQIRLAGCKGVLVINPALEGDKIIVRNSMRKFQSDSTETAYALNVCRVSSFTQGHLNKQFIMHLSILGVPDLYFLDKMLKYISNQTQLVPKFLQLRQKQWLAKEQSTPQDHEMSVSFSKEHKAIQGIRLVREFSQHLTNLKKAGSDSISASIEKALEKLNSHSSGREAFEIYATFGMSISANRFTASTVKEILNSENVLTDLSKIVKLREVREKARIPIEKSALLIGVCDETGTLEHGEIYLRIKPDNFDKSNFLETPFVEADELAKAEVITGRVVLARSPNVYPTEIRALQAVDATEKLGHKVNVIVFSSKDSPDLNKPQFQLMGNGDLDGDVYWVCWDPELTHYVKPVPLKEIKEFAEVTTNQVDADTSAKAACTVLLADNLGFLSNLQLKMISEIVDVHRVQGGKDDSLLQKVMDNQRVSKMTAIIQKSVDVPKHGEIPVFEETLKNVRIPDYLERNGKYDYQSKCILGRIFRETGKFKFMDNFLKLDHDISVLRVYKLHHYHLELASNKKVMHEILQEVYHRIVGPFKWFIVFIMRINKILNEESLYLDNPIKFQSKNLMTSREHYRQKKFTERMQQSIKDQTFVYLKQFNDVKERLQSVYPSVDMTNHLAAAVYFVTFAHFLNKDSQDYAKQYPDDKHLHNFFRHQKDNYEKRVERLKRAVPHGFLEYAQLDGPMRAIAIPSIQSEERGKLTIMNDKMLNLILGVKQLFSPVKLLLPLVFQEEPQKSFVELLDQE